MTDLIERLEALAGKVTPGDWAVGPYYIGTGPDEVMRGMILTDGDWPTGIICENDPPCGDTLSLDLDLICLLHNNLPTIIAALEVAELVRDEDWLSGVLFHADGYVNETEARNGERTTHD